jgi:hypothetical protein
VDTIDAAVEEISTLVEGDYGVWAWWKNINEFAEIARVV